VCGIELLSPSRVGSSRGMWSVRRLEKLVLFSILPFDFTISVLPLFFRCSVGSRGARVSGIHVLVIRVGSRFARKCLHVSFFLILLFCLST
jgi:hypothetical protein